MYYIIIENFGDTKKVIQRLNRRRTDNAIAKRKRTKGQNENDLQNTTEKIKECPPRTPLKTGANLGAPKG